MFGSPQVKRDMISSTRNFVQLPNNLKLRLLENYETSGKPEVGWRQSPVLSLYSRNNTLVRAAKIDTETDIKAFWTLPILFNSFTFSHGFSHWRFTFSSL